MFVVLKTSEIKKIKILYKLFFPPAIIRNCFFSSNYKNFEWAELLVLSNRLKELIFFRESVRIVFFLREFV